LIEEGFKVSTNTVGPIGYLGDSFTDQRTRQQYQSRSYRTIRKKSLTWTQKLSDQLNVTRYTRSQKKIWKRRN